MRGYVKDHPELVQALTVQAEEPEPEPVVPDVPTTRSLTGDEVNALERQVAERERFEAHATPEQLEATSGSATGLKGVLEAIRR